MIQHELDIITRIRGEIMSHKEHTGVNLFLVWGYPAVTVFLLEFAVKLLLHKNWYEWLWLGIPLIGAPLMVHFMGKDYDRTGRRTLDENIALQSWLFIGAASGLSGFTTGYAGVYEQSYCALQGILISLGCYLTGVVSRFRPMTVCGITGSLMSFALIFLQGDLWVWQLLALAVVTVITLIIPGHMSRYRAKRDYML